MTARAVCHTFKNLYTNFLLPPFVQLRNLVMSGIAGIDTWYRYRYRYLGIERGIDT